MHKHILNRLSKFTTPLLVVGLVVFGLAVATQAADAARLPQWATVNNTSSVTVAPGADVTVKFNVTTNGSGDANNWESTSWRVATNPGGSFNCENTNNHSSSGNYTETFDITVPTTPGTYSLYLKAHDGSSCTQAGQSGIFELAGAITVLPPYSAESYDSNSYSNVKNDFYQGETVFGKGIKLGSGNDYLKLVFRDPSNAVVKDCSWDYGKSTTCTYDLPNNAPLGEWDIKLYKWNGHDWDYKALDHFNVLQANYCGDGQVNQQSEKCDGSAPEHYTCTDQCQLEYIPYCGDQIVNGREQCDGQKGCSEQCTWQPATVNAQKVVCKNESDLPNYGDGGPNMTATTAQDWVDQSAGNCWLAEWDFQIAPNNTPNVDTLFSGEAGAPWTTFSGSTEVAAYTDKVWLREVWNEDYIPFSGDTTSNPWDEYSAEFYCNNDVLNYDNYDWIVDLQPATDYYCVGWNVMKTGTVTFYKDVRWNNDKVDVDDNTAFGVNVDGEYKGDVSENTPLVLELPIGTYQAEEVLPTGYAGIVDTAEFTVETDENTDVYFENQLACSEGATWAYESHDDWFAQGLRKNGTAVLANRSDVLSALGPADGNGTGTFVSLGQGGTLTVKFQYSVMDGEGDDISIHETTNGVYPEETAKVEVSYDGNTWYELGTASNQNPGADSYFDLASIGLPIAHYVRLTDTTDFNLHTSDADGFDVDAIDAVHGLCENVELYDLHGYKWHDANGNGYRDCSDQGEFTITSVNENIYDLPKLCETYSEDLLPGWTIFLDENLNETLDPGEPSMLTDDSDHFGWYWFENMLAGTYQVCEVVPADWQQTYPYFNEGVMCHTVTLPYGNDGDTCVPQYDLRQAAVQNAVAGPMCNFGNRLAPDLSIVKSVLVNGQESAVAEEGDTLTYTITVSNTGDAEATNLYLEDTTPTNTTLVADSWGGDLGDPVMNPDDSFTWGPFDLGSGATISVTFDVTVNAGLPIGVTNIENQATLYQAPEEEAEENLEATNFLQKLFGIRAATAAEANWSMIAQSNIVLTTVTIPEPEPEPEQPQGQVLGDETVPALSIEKTVNKAFANAGDTVTYTIVVTNTGDALAEGVTLIDTLPAGMHYTDTVAMDHSWVLGDIMDGDSKTVTYDVVINKGATPGSYTNTVVGWAAGVDNVTDTATLEVRLGAVLGAETLPVTGAGAATLAISTLAGLAAVILTNRKRK